MKTICVSKHNLEILLQFSRLLDYWPSGLLSMVLWAMFQEGVNGVNRLATKGEKYYRLPTKREKNYWLPTEKKLTDYRHGPPLSIFVFRKKRSEEHFVFFLAYEVTTLKVIIEFPVIFLLFGRKSAGSFCRTISGTRAHETSRCNISTTLFVSAKLTLTD